MTQQQEMPLHNPCPASLAVSASDAFCTENPDPGFKLSYDLQLLWQVLVLKQRPQRSEWTQTS